MRPSPVLFVDYDGVVHPDSVYLEKRRPVLRAKGTLFMWLPYLEDALDPFPEVQIVLSTSWVRSRGFNRSRNVLPEALRRRVIGATWHSRMGRENQGSRHLPLSNWWDRATRYQQIFGYVARAGLTNWLAIDDDSEGWPSEQADHLIQTDPNLGISDSRALAELRSRLLIMCDL